MSYMIRKAEKEDLPRIYEIYETARQFMRENGNHAQWGAGDRPEELLEDDISQGNLYVLEDAVADEAIIHNNPCSICFYRRRGSCLSEN